MFEGSSVSYVQWEYIATGVLGVCTKIMIRTDPREVVLILRENNTQPQYLPELHGQDVEGVSEIDPGDVEEADRWGYNSDDRWVYDSDERSNFKYDTETFIDDVFRRWANDKRRLVPALLRYIQGTSFDLVKWFFSSKFHHISYIHTMS